MATRTLKSFDSFHRLVPSIVRRLNDDPGLALRAMANPILAIEEMGIKLAPTLRREVELRLRFGDQDRERLMALSDELRDHAGVDFDPESADEVENVLFKRLKVKRPKKLGALHLRSPKPLGVPSLAKQEAAGKDPVETLRKTHPIVEPLLEYRRIAAGRPGFAPLESYERLKTTERPPSVSSIRIEVPTHEEDHDA